MKVSDYVVQFIVEQGVKHVFMVPGGGAMHLNNSFGRNKDIQYICNQHEQASAIAAEAYARVTNNLGVALVTTGPGGTNSVTGVAAAWLDSTPCVFISGQVKRSDIVGERKLRQLGVQEIDIVSMVKSITKYAVTIMDENNIRYHLEKALYLAKDGRPGPVWIDIPLDVQSANIEFENLSAFDWQQEYTDIAVHNNSEKIHTIIRYLNESERPIILAGNGIRLADARNDFLKLTELLKIPVLTTRLGVDLFASDNPLSMGMPGSLAPRSANFALQNSDLLLILGARMDMSLIAYAPDKLARGALKVMINIDKTEMEKLGSLLDVSLCANVREVITTLLEMRHKIVEKDRTTWLNRCYEWKQKYPFVTDKHRIYSGKVSVYSFAEIMSEELGEDTVILPGSSGNASEIFLTAFKAKKHQRIFHNKGTGAMGFCQPAAIGACLASGMKPTICIDGDGGFHFNIQELETIHRLNLPIKIFIMNNKGYASIRASQKNYFGYLTGADSTSGMTLPDYTAIAKAYKIKTTKIENSTDLRKKIRKILNTSGSVICDVSIIKDEPREPRVSSWQNKDGNMVSSSLENLAPFLDKDEFLTNMIIPPIDEEKL